MNIYDRARQIVAQSPRPMTLRDALSQLSRRRNFGRTKVQVTEDRRRTESPHFNVRLPYKDND